MPEQTQSNIEQTPLVHQPAPAVANPPPQSTNPPPKPPQNGNRDSDSEGDEPEVARDVAIGGMGAIVGGVVVGTTMMKLGTASGSNSDDAAKELEALKGDMVGVSALNFANVGQVKKDTLKKAITDAIDDAKGTNNAGAASGGNSDVAAKELQDLKDKMKEMSVLNLSDGQVNKDTLKAAITNAIENAKSANNTAAASANSVTDLQSKAVEEAVKQREEEFGKHLLNVVDVLSKDATTAFAKVVLAVGTFIPLKEDDRWKSEGTDAKVINLTLDNVDGIQQAFETGSTLLKRFNDNVENAKSSLNEEEE